MHRADIPFAVRLANAEGWGIPARDFARILQLDTHGSFIAVDAAEKVGLATTTSYGRQIAWIGNVVVRKQDRQRHIGRQLVEHAIRYLTKKRVRHIALYSFKENVPFYRRLGFVSGPRFARLRREPHSSPGTISKWTPTNPLTLSHALAMDQKAFGADRGRLLRLLLKTHCATRLGYTVGSSSSYIMAKRYEDMFELGPWVSFGLGRTELDSLLQLALDEADGKPVEVSCPLANRMAIEIMEKRNFRVINDGRVMFYRRMATIGQPKAVIAYGFLDKG
jgi:GNAT superfamily N-acetyltransferase